MDIIDFHAHILPRADHGSNSVENSQRQLSLAKEYGVSRIVATPHFYPAKENLNVFLKRREASFAELAEGIGKDMPPGIAMGAEVLICDNIEHLPGLESLCIGNSNIILLELPFNDFHVGYIYSVRNMIKNGYRIILAHADRYNSDSIYRLLDVGAQIQLNADALDSIFKRRILYRWVAEGAVVALGSDIHGADRAAYKHFAAAKKKLGKNLEYIKRQSDKIWNDIKGE